MNALSFDAGKSIFYNDGSEVMRATGGNVGIGTTNPSSKLDVDGDALISDDLTVGADDLHVDTVNGQVEVGRLVLNQKADNQGVTIKGFDDRSNRELNIDLDSSGFANIDATSGFRLQQTGTNIAFINSTGIDGFRMYDNIPLTFGATSATRYGLVRSNASGKLELKYGGTAFGAFTPTGDLELNGTVDGRDIAQNIPATLGTAGQVLAVNSGATATEWVNGGGSLPDFAPSLDSFEGGIIVSTTGDVVLTGTGFTAGNTFSFSAGVTVNSTTIDSPTQVTFNITAGSTAQAITCTLDDVDSYFPERTPVSSSATFNVNPSTLIPGDSVNWERVVGVTTGVGTMTSGSGSWTQGASFAIGTQDFELSFTIPSPTPGAGMFGIDASDPNRHYNTIDHCMYIWGDGAPSLYENGSNQSNSGWVNHTAGSTYKFKRVGTTLEWIQNGVVRKTSTIPAGKSFVFDSSFAAAGYQVTNIQFTNL